MAEGTLDDRTVLDHGRFPGDRPGRTVDRGGGADDVAPATRTGARGAVAGLVAALAMLVATEGPSLWTDEAATISASTRPLPELLDMAQNIDAVHTTYYLIMHAWAAAFGTGEAALRSASALAVGVAAAGTYVLAARLGGTRLALWSAVVFVLLPRVTWMGVEARPSAFVTAAAVWATVALVAALDRRRGMWWIAYGLLVAAGCLLSIYVVLVVAAHGVTVLLRTRSARVRLTWLAAAAGGGAVALPVALLAVTQAEQIGQNAMGLAELVRNVLVNQWFLGETPTVFSRTLELPEASTPWSDLWRPASVLLAAVAWTVVLTALVRGLRRGRPSSSERSLVVWLGPWVVLPTTVLALYAVVSQTYSARYLVFATPAVAIAVAAGLLALSVRWRTVVSVVLVVCAVPVIASQRTENAKSGADWRQTAAVVAEHCAPGDGVYFAPRAAPDGPRVRRTTRGVAVAYPQPFAGLTDVTLLRTPEQTDDLLGASARLESATATLRSLDRLCVVRRHDYPASARAADDAILDSVGLRVATRWSGPLDEVVVRGRT